MMAIRITLYIFLTLLQFYAANIFARRRLRIEGVADTFIATSVIVISQQILTGWILGLLNHLFMPELSVFNFIISFFLLIISGPRGGGWTVPFHFVIDIIRSWKRACRRLDVLIISCVDIALFIFLLARGIVFPPYSWDGLYYHLSEVGFMIQDGGLGFIERYPFDVFPRNIELTYLWQTIFIRHQLLMNCVQLPYVILAVFACYGILRKAGCRGGTSALAALMFPAIPIVIQQSTTAFIDIAVAACFLGGINFLVAQRMRISHVVLAGLAFGIVAGAKGSGLLLVTSAAATWIVIRIYGLIKRNGFRRYVLWIAVLLFAILLNGFWLYGRNWAVFGNPLQPYNVNIAGVRIFNGTMNFSDHYGPDLLGEYYDLMMSKSWPERMYYSWSDPKSWLNYGGRSGGYGPLWFLMLLPAFIAAFLIALIQRRWRFLMVAAMLLVPFSSIYQLAWWLRYSMFVLCIGMLGLAFVDGILRFSDARRLLRYTALALAFSACFFYVRVADRDLARLQYYIDYGPVYWHPTQFAAEGWQATFFREIYEYEKPGTTIFIDDSYKYMWVICLWNLDFSNRVVFADSGDRAEWFDRLATSNADFVLVGKHGMSYQWVGSYPERFELLHQSAVFAFYRVK